MRLYYIDGLKAIGCFFVFFCHFNGLLHLGDFIGPLKFLCNGEFAVALFLVLSGFSIAMSLSRDGSKERIQQLILSRYLRFALPMALVSTGTYVLYLLGCFHASDVAGILGQSRGANEYTNISISRYVATLIFAPMGYEYLNNPLWMMKYILEGTFLVIVIHLGVDRLEFYRKCFVILFAMILSVAESIYLTDVIAGMLIHEVWRSHKFEIIPHYMKRGLVLCLLLMSYYTAVTFFRESPTGASYKTLIFLLVGSTSLVISVAMSSALQRIFSIRALSTLGGGISFEFYLLHWVVICSLSSWIWLQSYQLASNYIIWINFIITTIIIAAMSFFMKNKLEPFICRPVHEKIMEYLYNY